MILHSINRSPKFGPVLFSSSCSRISTFTPFSSVPQRSFSLFASRRKLLFCTINHGRNLNSRGLPVKIRANVYNALGVSYVQDGKLDKGITQFETTVKLQPGYVTTWNNLGDAYEKKKELKSALKAFEEVLPFYPNNKIARPRRDALREHVQLYKGIPLKSKER